MRCTSSQIISSLTRVQGFSSPVRGSNSSNFAKGFATGQTYAKGVFVTGQDPLQMNLSKSAKVLSLIHTGRDTQKRNKHGTQKPQKQQKCLHCMQQAMQQATCAKMGPGSIYLRRAPSVKEAQVNKSPPAFCFVVWFIVSNKNTT